MFGGATKVERVSMYSTTQGEMTEMKEERGIGIIRKKINTVEMKNE